MDRELSVKFAWIHATVSKKPELMDDRCLNHDSSSAAKSSRGKKFGFVVLVYLFLYNIACSCVIYKLSLCFALWH